jgi:tetratricopeptide (TPR) repeat protein
MAISARIDELKKKFDENPRRYFASLANEYRKAGDLDQALFICQEYLPQQPGHMSGHIVMAQTLYEMGRLPDAKAEFEAALALDPENLIALRHLGDIARQSGDPRTARSWYQRVLEADPRNAEIVDVLASLRTTPMASAAAIREIPPTPLSNAVMPPPTPLSTPVMPPPAATPPAPAAFHAPEPVQEEHELLDLDSINLGETPLSIPAVKAPEPSSAPHDAIPIEHSMTDLDLGSDAFEADAFAIAIPEAAPEAPAVESIEPPIEPATDIELGLIEEDFAVEPPADFEPTTLEGLRSYEAGTLIKEPGSIDKSLDTDSYYDVLHGVGRSTPPEAAAAPDATPPNDDDFAPGLVEEDTVVVSEEHVPLADTPVESHDAHVTPHFASTPVEGLESLEDETEAHFTPHASSTPHEAATPIEPFTAHAPVTPVESSTPIMSSTPVASATPIEATEPTAHESIETPAHAATPSAGSEIFVTETMADLYLSQGHSDSALDIYRKLLEHRPGDPRLTERVREVESRVSGRTSRIATPEVTTETVSPRGPSIREFLVALVAPKPNGAAVGASAAHTESLPSADDVSGSIDALFSGSDQAADPVSSSVLAEAFSHHASDVPMLEGQPAHPASSELSLDQVFKATPVATEAQSDGFSFDQFFAGEATSSTASPPNSNTPPAEGTDDIAQFNAWLNGLKKT